MVVVDRERGGPVVSGRQFEEEGVIPTEGDVAVQTDQAALALAVGNRGLAGAVGEVPESGIDGEAVRLAGETGAETLVDVHTRDSLDVQPVVDEFLVEGSQEIVVGFVATVVVCIYVTVRIQRRRSVALVVIDQSVVQGDLRFAVLPVIIAIVEAVAISESQEVERHDIRLQLAEDLLRVCLVIAVFDGPVRTGDAVRRHVGFRRIEGGRKVLQVHQGDVAREFVESVNQGSTLEHAD